MNDPEAPDRAVPILEALDVTFAYANGTLALQGLSLNIPLGQRVAILGANGCGKTTLFLHLNGLLRPARGSIRLGGEPIRYDRAGLNDLRRRVGLIFQDPDSQLFAASVRQDISFGPLNLGWPEELVRARVEAAIRDARIEELADRPTHLLSYGEKKRVSIAGVLAMEPQVLVADEPTAGLDPAMTAHLLDLFDQIRARGTTVVLSTHDVELALAWADHVLILARGRLVAAGAAAELLSDPAITQEAHLVPPIVLQAYEHLRARGLLAPDAPRPRTAIELANLVASLSPAAS